MRLVSSNAENDNNHDLYFFYLKTYIKMTWHIHTTSIILHQSDRLLRLKTSGKKER